MQRGEANWDCPVRQKINLPGKCSIRLINLESGAERCVAFDWLNVHEVSKETGRATSPKL